VNIVNRNSPRRATETVAARSERYRKANRECAEIVLADLGEFCGPGSLMELWAQAVMAKEQARVESLRDRAPLADEVGGQYDLDLAGGAQCSAA
jgi:hypothetical protein